MPNAQFHGRASAGRFLSEVSAEYGPALARLAKPLAVEFGSGSLSNVS
jgi:hypothetical protein